MQIAAGIVVARIAGPTVLGTVAFGTAYVGMFNFLSGLGLGGAHIKLVSEERDLGKCIATYIRLKFFSTSFFIAAVVLFFLYQKYILNVNFESDVHQYVIFISLAVCSIQSFLNIPERTFAAKIEMAKHTLPQVSRMIIHHILRIILVLLGFKALALAMSNLFAIVVSIPLVLYLFRGYPFASYDKELAKQYIKIAAPLIVSAISLSLMMSVDKVLLQFFSDSEQVGYFTAGFVLGSLLLIVQGIGGIFFPLFSKAIAQNNSEYIKDKVNKWERFIFIFMMPVVLFATIYADSIILFVLGEKYIHSIAVMRVINIAILIRVLLTPYGNILTGKGLFLLVAKLEILNLILLSGTLVLFIHPDLLNLKAAGAAFSRLAVNLFSGILFVYFARQKLSIIKQVNNLKFVVFGAVNFLAAFVLYNHFISVWGNSFRLLFPLLYFPATYSSLILLRWIRKEDLEMLKALIDLKKMKQYIGSELKG